jgi:hypothetical protein
LSGKVGEARSGRLPNFMAGLSDALVSARKN